MVCQFGRVDLYTHNFAYVGTLTTGNGAGNFSWLAPAGRESFPRIFPM